MEARAKLRSPFTNPGRRTGRYERSFVVHPISQAARGPYVIVENTDRKALWIEKGTPRHEIRPRRRRGRLRFYWRRKRVRVSLRHVNHPGTRAYRILDKALGRVMRRQR